MLVEYPWSAYNNILISKIQAKGFSFFFPYRCVYSSVFKIDTFSKNVYDGEGFKE